ncbi:MAG: hypothetical protein P4L33_12225 [Capsulimonadaceae bacterium]|nr:hypothetical protein [Capsulimonadaceae bacterium]
MSIKRLCAGIAALASCATSGICLASGTTASVAAASAMTAASTPQPATPAASVDAQLAAARKAIVERDAVIARLRTLLTDRDDIIAKLLAEIRSPAQALSTKSVASASAAPSPPAALPAETAQLGQNLPPPPAGVATSIATVPAIPFGGQVEIHGDAFFSALGIKDFTVIRVDNDRDSPIAFTPQVRVVCRDGSKQPAEFIQASASYDAIDPRTTDERTIEAKTLRHDAQGDFSDHKYDIKSPEDMVVPPRSTVYFKISYVDVVQNHPLRIEFTGATLDGYALAYPGPHTGPYALTLVKIGGAL